MSRESTPLTMQHTNSYESISGGSVGAAPPSAPKAVAVVVGGAGPGSGAASPSSTASAAARSARASRAQAERDEADSHRKGEICALYVAMGFCFVFMVVELVAGYLAHSLAIFTDAAHLLTDVGSYMLSIFSLYAASRQRSKSMSYGWYRAEVLGTLVSVFTIWALVIAIVYEAVNRTTTMYACAYEPKTIHESNCIELETKTMLIVGVLGLLVNLGCAAILTLGGSHGHSHYGAKCEGHGHSHGGAETTDHSESEDRELREATEHHDHDHGCDHGDHGHSHDDHHGHSHEGGHDDSHEEHDDHGHDHGSLKPKPKKRKSGFAINAAFLHALGDCIQSVGVIVAGAFAYYMNLRTYGRETYKLSPYNLADPVSSVVFAVVTLFTTRKLLKQLLGILMEATPPGIDVHEVQCALEAIPGVVSVHDLHIWSIASEKVALSVHIVADNHVEALHATQDICEHRFGITHSTVQVDPSSHGSDRCASNICS